MAEPIPIDVAADDLASEHELRAVDAAFRDAGFEVQSAAAVGRKSAEVLDWVLYVTLGAPIAAFFTAMASEAGKDSYSALNRWAKSIWEARRGAGTRSGSIVLRDSDHTNLVLSSRLPDEALDALERLNWDEVRGDYLVWNEAEGAWRDPMKQPEGF
jgi:hypothetical protein